MDTGVPQRSTQYDEWIHELQGRDWSLADDVWFYQQGEPPDVAKWHDVDYLELFPLIYGRRCGSNGIGKLTEVALTRIRDTEIPPLFDQDPDSFTGNGLYQSNEVDVRRMQDQQEHYAGILEEHGITVHWIDFPDPPMSAFGPMQNMWAAQELLVVNGGSIISKLGWNPYAIGRTEFLARWAFTELGIPPLITIAGKGVCEAGASIFLAQDVFLTANSAAYNQEGLDQMIPAIERTSEVEHLHTQVMRLSSAVYFDPKTGICAHPDMLIGPLDIKKAMIFSAGVDTETHLWLRKMGYQLAEVDYEEHLRHSPANLTTLEPGLVIMQEEAPKSVGAARAMGAEVITVPYSEFNKAGGGLACATMRITREPGPSLGV